VAVARPAAGDASTASGAGAVAAPSGRAPLLAQRSPIGVVGRGPVPVVQAAADRTAEGQRPTPRPAQGPVAGGGDGSRGEGTRPVSSTGGPSPAAAAGGSARAARAVQRIVDAGSVAVEAGIGRRDDDGSIVFAVPPAPVVQRPGGEPEVVPPTRPPPDQTGPTTAVPTTTDAVLTTGAVPAGGAPDLDDLARRLFDPLAARLRAELRLDRERAGLLLDLPR
jgi:hypothetical protein